MAAIMMIESLLAYAHILAFLGLTVFLTSQTALCRPEWLNAAAVQRLAALGRWVHIFTWAVLLTGLARIHLGMKGAALWGQPLLHVKVTLFVLMAFCIWRAHRLMAGWPRALAAGGALPDATALRQARRWLMVGAHLMVLAPLAAVWLARGILAA